MTEAKDRLIRITGSSAIYAEIEKERESKGAKELDKFNRLSRAMKKAEADRVEFYAKAHAAPTPEQSNQYTKRAERSSGKWLRLSRQQAICGEAQK